MATPRYPQFCALARAAEVLGERWNLLIVRELLLGPKRFSDLRERLDGISPSVLTARLGRARRVGLVRRAVLPPPAASAIYELTEQGEALRPAIYELIRWGGPLLFPARKRDRVEPDWMRLALSALARRGAVPARSILLDIREGARRAVVQVSGGPHGTTVTDEQGPAEVTVTTDVRTLFAIIGGALGPVAAAKAGRIAVQGNLTALADLVQLFDVERARPARA
jgi:DNA-binding HxlR family transcriptional regulator/putative sterol carrier protein